MASLYYTRTNLIVSQAPGFASLADTDVNKKVIANSFRENVPGMSVVEDGSIQKEIMASTVQELPDTDSTKKVIANAIRENIPGMSVVEDGSIQKEITDKIDNLQIDITEVVDKLPTGDIADSEDLQKILKNTASIKFSRP